MNPEDLQKMRREYVQQAFDEKDAAAEPLQQFKQWFDEAAEKVVDLPNAMTLATTSADGQPDARVVLLKDYNEHGFAFFTNYSSSKAQDLNDNPCASLLFYWSEFDRQIRIQGTIKRVSQQESTEYFKSRPIDSQISAVISAQSHTVESRQALEEGFAAKKAEVDAGKELLCPETWGGFRLKPTRFEFWQGRESRLHDRLVYTLKDKSWQLGRLAP